MISLKPIKLDRSAFDVAAHKRAIKAGLDEAARKVKQDFEKTAANWKDKPEFSIERTAENERVIGTDHQKYTWADDGTESHDIGPIVPVNKKAITIRGKGTPKSVPHVIGSRSGSQGGVVAVRKRTKVIHHPGTAPREFSTVIADKAEQTLADAMQRAIDGVA